MARIEYNNPATKGGNYVENIINSVIASWHASQRIKSEMDQIVGFPADFTKLEVPFGLTSGGGEAFYNTVVNLKANLDSTCALLGTVDRIA